MVGSLEEPFNLAGLAPTAFKLIQLETDWEHDTNIMLHNESACSFWYGFSFIYNRQTETGL